MPANFDTLVTLAGGVVVSKSVLDVLWELEDRGARFELKPDGGFRVIPPSVLTADDTAFLRAHRSEARQILDYQAADRHLLSTAY
jgi:hypothetical protein